MSALAEKAFDPAEFPFEFLVAFGNKETTVKRLRTRSGNTSDVEGGVLQRNHIHLAIAARGQVGEMLGLLRASPKTTSNKARFILATDGVTLEAEDLTSGETVAPDYEHFANDFAFFLPLAGISTVKAIKNNPIDIKATGRLNKLYIELLKDNPDWGTPERRHDLNQFMARMIFCFFAEDTGIFLNGLFTSTIKQMSDSQSGNTHEVLGEMFRAMNTPTVHDGRFDNRYRKAAGIKAWADRLPYVNGGMFSDKVDCPRFSRLARSYLLHAGELDWRLINPDIFGSMIQAVTDEDERGELGMHYTSVPNILKVLNPLFLDDLRTELKRAGDNLRMLRNLRKRLSRIRVFDPACGSGNFLVIAYKEMRAIEDEIVRRSVDAAISWIPLSNFYGIEIKGFAAEIARLALLIAEFQCDVLYIDQMTAKLNVLPLHKTGNIVTGNALRLDWLDVCPVALPPEEGVGALTGPLGLDRETTEVETYICGNPPYAGLSSQTIEQKADLRELLDGHADYWKSFDYVAGWFFKASRYVSDFDAVSAFVATNSICQGQQVPMLWPILLADGVCIPFAHSSFRWSNLASYNAGVTVVVVALAKASSAASPRRLFSLTTDGTVSMKEAGNINAYLVPSPDIWIRPSSRPLGSLPPMFWGNKPTDDGNLLASFAEANEIVRGDSRAKKFVRPYFGSAEFIDGTLRYCVWVTDEQKDEASAVVALKERFERVRNFRESSKAAETRPAAKFPHRFRQIQGHPGREAIIVPIHSSETRAWLPVGALAEGAIVSNAAFALYDTPLWNLALVGSRLHLVWIATICGKLETRYRYSNTLGWNTFPVPPLTERNKADLTRCAEDILLAREAHFPMTIADLYDPETMPENLE